MPTIAEAQDKLERQTKALAIIAGFDSDQLAVVREALSGEEPVNASFENAGGNYKPVGTKAAKTYMKAGQSYKCLLCGNGFANEPGVKRHQTVKHA